MRDGLGDAYVERLFALFKGRVPAEADFVVYWIEKGWEAIKAGRARRVGLVATNSVRGGANRKVLETIADAEALQEAWADEPWILQGAAVRVSMLGYGEGFVGRQLDGRAVATINADLTSAAADLTKAARLSANSNIAFQGIKFGSPFEIDEPQARLLLNMPINPNGLHNAKVVRRWTTGLDIARRPEERWVVDLTSQQSEQEAALFEGPFAVARAAIQTENQRRAASKKRLLRAGEPHVPWWAHQRSRGDLWRSLEGMSRYVATPEVSKHRLFVFFPPAILPTGSIYAIARDDDATFGILHSRFHELWSLRLGTSLEDRPRYTPSTTFETFPFPEGLTPNIPAADYAADPRAVAIAAAAEKLNALREAWLDPPDLTVRVPEVVPGYPDRILPKDEAAAKILKKRTLTNLYNERPAWLAMAHAALDDAVADAYGWPRDLSDEQVLERLFALNQSRAAAEAAAAPAKKTKRTKA